jgi:hypothetical protein
MSTLQGRGEEEMNYGYDKDLVHQYELGELRTRNARLWMVNAILTVTCCALVIALVTVAGGFRP